MYETIIIRDVTDFHPTHIFECGQAFRWNIMVRPSVARSQESGVRSQNKTLDTNDANGFGEKVYQKNKLIEDNTVMPNRSGAICYRGIVGTNPAIIEFIPDSDDRGKGTVRIIIPRICNCPAPLLGKDIPEMKIFWEKYLDLKRDYGKIKEHLTKSDPVMREAVSYGEGIRILNQDPWETLISFIISQNNHIPRIKSCIEALCAEFGEPVVGVPLEIETLATQKQQEISRTPKMHETTDAPAMPAMSETQGTLEMLGRGLDVHKIEGVQRKHTFPGIEETHMMYTFPGIEETHMMYTFPDIEETHMMYTFPGNEETHMMYTFPKIEALVSLDPWDLERCRLGYRADYILGAARQVTDAGGADYLKSLRSMPYEKAEKELLKIKGVGPKVAACVLLFGLGHLDGFPVDVWMRRAMNELYGIDTKGNMAQAFASENFGAYAGIAQQYLFYYIRRYKN